jgi:hypothetical protein
MTDQNKKDELIAYFEFIIKILIIKLILIVNIEYPSINLKL